MKPFFKIMTADAYKVEIFLGGDLALAKSICLDYCTEVGLCVTLDPTLYVYRGGHCDGIRVGLINYARFPKSRAEIWETGHGLAKILLDKLGQGSYTIQDDEKSTFYTERVEDGCCEKTV